MDAAPGANAEQIAFVQLLGHVRASHSYNDVPPRFGRVFTDPGKPVGDASIVAIAAEQNQRTMDRTSVFSKAGKGLLEIKSKSNRLSKDEFRVLNLVDGKATLADLVDKSRVTEVELRKILQLLSNDGFIKELVSSPASGAGRATSPAQAGGAEVDDLDFTQVLGPSKSATPVVSQGAAPEQRQREDAERKAAEAAAAKAREETALRAKAEAEQRARSESEKRSRNSSTRARSAGAAG
jgi:hypothetical protein